MNGALPGASGSWRTITNDLVPAGGGVPHSSSGETLPPSALHRFGSGPWFAKVVDASANVRGELGNAD